MATSRFSLRVLGAGLPGVLLSPLTGIGAMLLAAGSFHAHADPRYLGGVFVGGAVGGGLLARRLRYPWHWLSHGLGAGGLLAALVCLLNFKLRGPSAYLVLPVTARNLSYRHLPLPKANNLTVTFRTPTGHLREEAVPLRDSTRATRADSVQVGVAAGLLGPPVYTSFQLR